MSNLNIKIKYFDDKYGPIERINKIEQGDWIDLRAATDITLFEGQPAFIPLGVAMKLPDGYEAHIAPRSSTFKKWGIIQTNSVGVIDNSYCGDNDEWKMAVVCINANCENNIETDKVKYDSNIFGGTLTKLKASNIKKGDRVCQFRIMEKQPEITFTEVEHLDDKDRGGFGSTGTN